VRVTQEGADLRNPEHHRAETLQDEEPPPFLGTWRRVYLSVVLYTAALVAGLYLITVLLNR